MHGELTLSFICYLGAQCWSYAEDTNKLNELSEEEVTKKSKETEPPRSKSIASKNIINNNWTISSNKSDHECKICTNKFKTFNNLKNHETKFHNQQSKCTLCTRTFGNNKSLETHISVVHRKGNSKHTLEREPI